jgi:alkyl hydroperoxide reductase subunit F
MALEFKLDLPPDAALSDGEEKNTIFDLAILGGGPAGMTAAVYALRKQMSVVMISPDLGGQVLKTSGVENYMGYQYISGPELSDKFSEQIRQFPLKLLSGESVVGLTQTAAGLFLTSTDGNRTVQSRTLIVATGKRWRKLNVPGEETYAGHGVVYCAVCDAPFFKGLQVVVAGGGNSAVTGALDLIRLNSPVTLINYAAGWQADPVLLEQIKDRATLLDNHRILEILGDGQVVTGVKIIPGAGGEERVLPARGVFVEIGLLPNTEIYKGFVELNDQQEVVVDSGAHTSRTGVFGAGDCTSVSEKQIIIAAGDGAKAALAAYQHVIYMKK